MANSGATDQDPVVIIGAGFAGLAAARVLGAAGVATVVIDRQNHHLFQPLLYQVATAGLSAADIAAPIRAILRQWPSVSVLMDTVVGIDRAARQLQLASGGSLRFGALIIASGARHAYFRNPEWAAHAPGIKTIDDAIRVRRDLLLALERAETMRAEQRETRAEHLTFVVVGGGPTGVELAGAIAELARHAAERDFPHITRNCVRVVLVDSGDRLLKALPPSLSAAAAQALAGLGVEVRLNSRVTALEPGRIMLGDDSLPACVTLWAAGVAASPAASWLGAAADGSGRVIVGSDLALPDDPAIFVVGDTAAATSRDGQPVPGVATAAKQMGAHAARAILARRAGQAVPAFRYRHPGSMATIGRSHAVADLGWLKLAGAPAWLLWCTVHLWFLAGFRNRLVVGANWLWRYLTFESSARLITQQESDMR
ncbi:FAD-dependent oxidoreductase [Sandarakinorhabdus cyanobacteriorum]|uniref:NADH:ubiquinone reductase (non-electrogenic) n=1 Tax=Sandarakinorhabdus cyanobacteriorum TaxID=1981098 RepID=A0A255Y7W0_9SPHN|nr:NAD(P)/FAD-dependent oxidoreductase [Sandarakinorhabdus cyanobacteriorum]OYQ25312.1 FAD-dependent oxidoreductase [Sandarakinorhabdus cyanobacteriorum]